MTDMSEERKIEPCPFCGNRNVAMVTEANDDGIFLRCEKCKAEMWLWKEDPELEQAILEVSMSLLTKRWNARTPS